VNLDAFLLGVVGPCGSGKTTLVTNLRVLGYRSKVIAQEHSYVADMWFRLTQPDILIFLQASYSTTKIRKKFDWSDKEYQEQQNRLRHALANADIIVDTDLLSPADVCSLVVSKIPSSLKNRQSH
jgi:ABC-type glutathione transport system ATPase component